MYYLQSRYYNPEIGRFICADDIDVVSVSLDSANYDKNLFAYCDNNPVVRVDVSGMLWETVFDVASLCLSVIDVYEDPTDILSWAGFIGDAVDLIPFVTGVGETIRVIKIAETADDLYDTVKVVEKTDDAIDTAKTGKRIFNVSKQNSEVFQSFSSVKGRSYKRSGHGRNRMYYEWDYTHNDIEVYDRNGKHLGSMDPTTGKMYKDAVKGRTLW